MIVDAHLHIWDHIDGSVGNERPVRAVGNGVITIGGDAVLGMPATFTDCNARAEMVLGEFDAAGVDAGVIVQEYLDGEQNDYLLRTAASYPDRFFMYGLLDWFDVDSVYPEAIKLFDQGYRGLKLCAGHLVGKVKLDDARLLPVYEHMAAHGKYLSVDLAEGDEQAVELENIIKGFPGLKVAIGHFGMPTRGGWPSQLNLCRYENVMLESGGIIWLYRDEGYPFDNAIGAILEARDVVGIEKLMWGSDWPRTMVDFTYRQSLDFVRESEALTQDEKDLFLGGNAERFYALVRAGIERRAIGHITEG